MSSGTPTPILGLNTFTNSDAFLESEVDANSAIIDTIPPTICTSTTRPTTKLYTGRMIYETDTLRYHMWYSNGWLHVNSVPLALERRRTNTLAVPNGSTVVFDNFQTFIGGTNTAHFTQSAGVFTMLRPGIYHWSMTAEWMAVVGTGSGTGRRRLGVYVNGTSGANVAYEGINDDMPDNGQSLNSGFRQSASGEVILAAGDTVQPFAFNSSGTAMTIDTNASFMIYRVT